MITVSINLNNEPNVIFEVYKDKDFDGDITYIRIKKKGRLAIAYIAMSDQQKSDLKRALEKSDREFEKQLEPEQNLTIAEMEYRGLL